MSNRYYMDAGPGTSLMEVWRLKWEQADRDAGELYGRDTYYAVRRLEDPQLDYLPAHPIWAPIVANPGNPHKRVIR